ncbi:hypothetical protein [Bradyrhizobium sp. 2TAF24]|uniref:hypothetical protein n=1 Tax=Bradyrhizobium sp. 2TAF24 TaxID=3233011 RepID=UPI003F8ED727
MRATILRALLLLGLFWPAWSLARAEEAGDDKPGGRERIDTQFIFGLTAGADVGEVGEKELEHQTAVQWGKRDGAYAALTDQLRFETSPVDNIRFEVGVPVAYQRISGVSGLDDRNGAAFNGVVAELRYRLLDREHAPFALTVGIEPHWSRADETSGVPVDNFGGELSVALDREVIRERVFAALNVVYDPEATRLRSTGIWQHDSTLAVAGAVTTQVSSGVFVGAEARYLRKYEGLGLGSLAGKALYVGPTTFVRLSKTLAVSGAWDIQVAGRATDLPGFLDLAHFTRHQALLRVEYNF